MASDTQEPASTPLVQSPNPVPPRKSRKGIGGAPKGSGSRYKLKIAEEICRRLASGRETLTSICEDEHIPDRWTVYMWRDEHPEFASLFVRAQEMRLEAMRDQIDAISNTPHVGEETDTLQVDKGDGTPVTRREVRAKRREMIEHRKLQIEARRFLIITGGAANARDGSKDGAADTGLRVNIVHGLAEYEQSVQQQAEEVEALAQVQARIAAGEDVGLDQIKDADLGID